MNEYRRLIRFVFPHIWVLILAGTCMIISSAFSGVSMGMLVPLVDNIVRGGKIVLSNSIYIPPVVVHLIDYVNALPPERLLNGMMIVVLVLWLLKNFFEFLQSYFMNDVSQRVIRDVKDIIYQKLLTLSMDFYSKNSTGKLVSRITYDSAVIRDAISTGLTDLIYQPVQLLVYFGLLLGVTFLFSISWTLIFASLVIFPLVVYPVVRIGKRLKSISRKSQEQVADINSTLYETISGIRVVKAFSMEDYEGARFKAQNLNFYKLSMKAIKRMTIVSPLTEFVGMICIGLVLWIAGSRILSGELSLGAFVTFLVALLSFMRPIKRLTNVYGINQQAMAAATRIFEVLDTKPSVVEKVGGAELGKIKEGIVFKDVRFGYEEKEVLKGISVAIKAGEIVAFVGPSGAGKTTIVNLIPRFYDPTAGTVTIDGTDLREVTFKSLRAQIGIVTQETILFNDTVAANISYGKKGVSAEDVERAARIANAHEFIMNMPKGYDTVIGERGFRLSGGEKQRLAIARAVFKDPPILILDEATSQLDTDSETLVQGAIDHLMEGRTVCAIAHRLSTIKHADRICVIDAGRITETGTHDELIGRSGLYRHLYDMQFRDTPSRA